MRDDSDIILIDLSEVFLKLFLNGRSIEVRSLHDFYNTLLITEQIRVQIDILDFLLFGNFTQQIILANIFHSSAFISCTQIEHCLSHKQLLGKRIVYPFLN